MWMDSIDHATSTGVAAHRETMTSERRRERKLQGPSSPAGSTFGFAPDTRQSFRFRRKQATLETRTLGEQVPFPAAFAGLYDTNSSPERPQVVIASVHGYGCGSTDGRRPSGAPFPSTNSLPSVVPTRHSAGRQHRGQVGAAPRRDREWGLIGPAVVGRPELSGKGATLIEPIGQSGAWRVHLWGLEY